MSRYCIVLTFDGTDYCGWQVQKNAKSVCATVQMVLETLLRQKINLFGCGRTDAGVHALNYCASFDSDMRPDNTFLVSVNALLPYDIRVKSIEEVPDDFHARYSAKGKRYIYKIVSCMYMDPFLRGYAYHCPHPLDREAMERASALFVGEHDFAAFMASGSDILNTVRKMYFVDIEQKDNIITVGMTANGFLHKMARGIAGTLLDVGRGRIAEDSVGEIIESKNRARIGITLPPCGLYMDRVYYEE